MKYMTYRVQVCCSLDFITRGTSEEEVLKYYKDPQNYTLGQIMEGKAAWPPQKMDIVETIYEREIDQDSIVVEEVEGKG